MHVRVPEKTFPLSSTANSTLRYRYLPVYPSDSRRRAKILLEVAEALANEEKKDKLIDSLGKLIVNIVNRKKNLKDKVIEGLNLNYSKILTS